MFGNSYDTVLLLCFLLICIFAQTNQNLKWYLYVWRLRKITWSWILLADILGKVSIGNLWHPGKTIARLPSFFATYRLRSNEILRPREGPNNDNSEEWGSFELSHRMKVRFMIIFLSHCLQISIHNYVYAHCTYASVLESIQKGKLRSSWCLHLPAWSNSAMNVSDYLFWKQKKNEKQIQSYERIL